MDQLPEVPPRPVPSFDRQQVDEHGLPTGKVSAGQKVSFTLSNLDLTSLGSPRNPTVDVYLNTPHGARKVGTYKTTNDGTNGGAAIVSFTVPQGLSKPSTISAIARPSGTLIGPAPKTTTKVSRTVVTYGHRPAVVVHVTSPTGDTPTGKVILRASGRELGRATLSAGIAKVRLTGFSLASGHYTMTARYQGDATHSKSSDTATLVVRRATTHAAAQIRPDTARADRTRVKVLVRVWAFRHQVSGHVQLRTGGHVYRAKLRKDVAVFHLLPYGSTGRKDLVIRYLGNNRDRPVKDVEHLLVHH